MRWSILIAVLALAACKDGSEPVSQEASPVLAELAARTAAEGRPEVPALPSGMAAGLQEVRFDEKPDGQFSYFRFRFVVPAIAGARPKGVEERAGDMEFLCNEYALKTLSGTPRAYDRIVISMADQETEFGVANPQATQFFESFRVENGVCIWEDF
ncbi:DUF6497 family protein [Alisedimentitalea sp. MJ-SS2]|uniref:DUF6497 family protein n=1 Tax=Aliisedimentitalea sp. MJ-SS2 TaxID=3049795 RepID=UPI00290C6F71|nr:DUF6497 family protein [Alisedimentitalea sp. MJ-SS2]MDU8926632.1 DUF6497 family protein [Alisedimentitalea sp. MJ-SS2]